jgi:hypothetical protein
MRQGRHKAATEGMEVGRPFVHRARAFFSGAFKTLKPTQRP